MRPVLDLYSRVHEKRLEVYWLWQERFGCLFACAQQRVIQIPEEAQGRLVLRPLGRMRASPLTV